VEEYKAIITRIVMGTPTKDDRKSYGQVSKADRRVFLKALEAVRKWCQNVLDNPAGSETEKASAGAAINKLDHRANVISNARQREDERDFQNRQREEQRENDRQFQNRTGKYRHLSGKFRPIFSSGQ
jgi:uncharacterized membrane protein